MGIINRAYDTCFNDEVSRLKLSRIKHDFKTTNGYPNWIFNQTHQKVIESRETSTKKLNSIQHSTTEDIVLENAKEVHIMSLPYKDEKGQNIIKSLNNTLFNVLPDGHGTKIVYAGKKLGSFFSMNDETKKQHQHDLIYYIECPESTCSENDIGKVARRLQEREMNMRKKIAIHICYNTRTSQVTQ